MSIQNPQGTIVLHEANVRDVTFQLRRVGRREPFDVTGQLIRLTVQKLETETDSPLEPYDADPLHVDADFATGKVVIQVDTRVTGVCGSYEYSLTLWTGTEIITLQTGQLEVHPRPGFPGQFVLTGSIEIDVQLTANFVVT